MSEQSKDDPNQTGLSIDVETMTVTGHFVLAGRDGSVNVNTGGDVAQNTKNTIMVGGVETTPEICEQLKAKIQKLENKFKTNDEVDKETKEAASYYFETIKKLLLNPKKPNPKILIESVKSFAKLGPFFLKGISEVFGEPLAAEIVGNLSKQSYDFFRMLSARANS